METPKIVPNGRTWKDIVISVLIGALIAFITALLEGALTFLQGYGNNVAGGVGGALVAAVRLMRG